MPGKKGKGHRFVATEESLKRLEGEERSKRLPPQEIVPRIGLSKEDTVLDLGAGLGFFSFPIAEAAREVIALDIEPQMLRLLAQRAKERGVENIVLLRGDIGSIPLRSESVNRVFAAFVYHEVPDRSLLMQEAARVLRPKGRLTIVDFRKRFSTEGPPFWVRRTAKDVQRTASEWFSNVTVSTGREYYQVELSKRS